MNNSEVGTIHKELHRLHEEKLKVIEEMREAGMEYVVEDYVDPDDEKDPDEDENTLAKSLIDDIIDETENDPAFGCNPGNGGEPYQVDLDAERFIKGGNTVLGHYSRESGSYPGFRAAENQTFLIGIGTDI